MSQDIINGTHKGCCACKRELPLRCFEKDSSRRSGYLSRCKDCYQLLRAGKSDPVLRGRSVHERKQLDDRGMAPCYRCKMVKPKHKFNKDKAAKYGIMSTCRDCKKEYRKIRRMDPDVVAKDNAYKRAWDLKNQDKLEQYKRTSALREKEKRKEKQQISSEQRIFIRRHIKFLRGISSYKSKIAFCVECGKPFRKKIKKHKSCSAKCNMRIQHRVKDSKYYTDELYRLKTIMRVGARRAAKGEGTAGAWRYLKGIYTPKQLADHLRSTLPDGYSWDDFMDGTLHIDHIRPLSWFDIKEPGDAEFLKCWALDNLQLLPGADNVRKGNRWEG